MACIHLTKGEKPIAQSMSTNRTLVNCETLYRCDVAVLCLKDPISEQYRAVAVNLSDSQPENGYDYSILLTGLPCKSPSRSIETLLCRSARMLQRCIIDSNGKESLRIADVDALSEIEHPDFKSGKISSLPHQQLDADHTQSHLDASTPIPTAKRIWMATSFRYNNSNYSRLNRWNPNNKPFVSFIWDVIQPFVDLQDDMNVYIDAIRVTLDQTEYHLSHCEGIDDFFRSRSEASGHVPVRMEVYQATRSDRLCINPS